MDKTSSPKSFLPVAVTVDSQSRSHSFHLSVFCRKQPDLFPAPADPDWVKWNEAGSTHSLDAETQWLCEEKNNGGEKKNPISAQRNNLPPQPPCRGLRQRGAEPESQLAFHILQINSDSAGCRRH